MLSFTHDTYGNFLNTLRWDDGRPRSARAKEGLSAYDWLPGMFDGAKHTAAHVRDQVCRFLAMKVRGWCGDDLREQGQGP